jgi:glycosyltransferase involved in cell wall biosynthesis
MVSVCIATFNSEKYISDQLKSILAQLSSHDEVIISDDSSTDKTIACIQELNDSRIKLFENQRFRNPIRNFEFALYKAKNPYVFLADHDDIWLENKVAACLEHLKTNDVVVTNCKVVNENLETIEDSYFKILNSGPGLMKNLWRNTYLGCCMAFRKDILNIALPFPPDIPMHDIWLGFVASLFYKTAFEENTYVLYRRHGSNATTTSGPSSNNFITKMKFRYNLIKYIPILIQRAKK